jgi:hypothetical protein
VIHRLRNILAKVPKDRALHDRIRTAYWAALDAADSPAVAEASLPASRGDEPASYLGFRPRIVADELGAR